MKRIGFFLMTLVFVLSFATSPLHAATLDDIVGIWSATYHPTFKVSGYFKEKTTTFGDVSFYPTQQVLAWENDNGIFRTYQGTFVLQDGKKIVPTMELDDFLATITHWIQEKAGEAGYTVTGISYSITSFRVTPSKINSRRMSLGKVKVTIRGTVSAWVNGVYQTKRLSYKSVVTFGPKISDTPW
jgi:hypothetical protein